MSALKDWLARLIEDPDGSPSSTRVAALLLSLAAIFVAVYGRIVGKEQAETILALLGGGAASFFSRTKSTP